MTKDFLVSFVCKDGSLDIPSEGDKILSLTGIYRIRCLVNNFTYYGSASSPRGFRTRFQSHLWRLKNARHHSWILQRDWKRYGASCFEFQIIEIVSPEQCINSEQAYIDRHGIGEENSSYNICPTANSFLGRKASAETRRRISLALKGRVRTQESINKMSKALKGRILTPKNCENFRRMISQRTPEERKEASRRAAQISAEVCTGIARSDEVRESIRASKLGAKMPLESRQKMSQAKKGKPLTGEHIANRTAAQRGRPKSQQWKEKVQLALGQLFCVTSPEGQVFEIKNLSQFCRERGLSQGNMSAVSKGRLRHHKGWQCRKIKEVFS
jgi:group I intron endonuclease